MPPYSFLLCLTWLASDEDITLHIQKDGGKPTPLSRGERASVATPKVYAGYTAARQSHDTGQNRPILSRGAKLISPQHPTGIKNEFLFITENVFSLLQGIMP